MSLVHRCSPEAGVEVHQPNPPANDVRERDDEAGKQIEDAVKVAGRHGSDLDVWCQGNNSHSCRPSNQVK